MAYPYCIECECTTVQEDSSIGEIHSTLFIDEHGQLDIDWCPYPCGYTYVEYPEFRDDWNDEEPSIEDLGDIEPDWDEIL